MTIKKYLVLGSLFVTGSLLLLMLASITVQAVCPTSTTFEIALVGDSSSSPLLSVAEGFGSIFNVSGSRCLSNTKINPTLTYDGLKIEFYDRSSSETNEGTIVSNKVNLIKTDLVINTAPSIPNKTVVFVDGNLTINSNIDITSSDSGIVFIVSGNIDVKPSVTQIDAILVTFGQFCSAYTTVCEAYTNANKLTIKGSVIALSTNVNDTPKFVRQVENNLPGEEIVYQAKYLAIMREVFGRDLRIWSEIY